MTLIEILEKFWPLIVGFLGAGTTWFWANKKTKAAKKLEQANTESVEIQNMKSLMEIFQNDFKKELINKNETIEKLTVTISALNEKVDRLTEVVETLQKQMAEDDFKLLKLAKQCPIRKSGQVCKVLEHLKNKINEN